MLPSMKRIIVVGVCILCSVIPVWTFVHPFGARSSGASLVASSKNPSQLHRAFPPLFAAGRPPKKDDISMGGDDNDWEPDAADLQEIDLSAEDDLDIPDEDAVVSTPDDDDGDDRTVLAVDDDDDDDEDADDDIDEDLDIWEEDEDVVDDEEGDIEYEDDWEMDGEGSEVSAEGSVEEEEWEEEEEVPLQDFPDDPNYMAQKKLLEETLERRTAQAELDEFDEIKFIMDEMTPEQAEAFEEEEIQKQVNAKVADLMSEIDEEEIANMDYAAVMANTTSILDDPYENEGEKDIMGTGLSDDLLERYDAELKTARERIAQENPDKVIGKADQFNWTAASNQTIEEMEDCLREIGGSSYNVSNWLIYDLDFNVSNLILAAVQHNPQAPILFQHWYPQLVTYERYQHARDRDFDFNWDDVRNADIEELERYYHGFGYEEIPKKAPAETGIIGLEELDEEEMKMVAFENWVKEVYNPEWDRKDFDDDDFQDEDNVFSKFFEAPQHPDLPTFEDALEDIAEWEAEADDNDNMSEEYAHMMGHSNKYKYIKDEEFEREFRGHLIVAITPTDKDLETAGKITKRMREEFGKKVYVEIRAIAHAREEDNVFEVWLESYEVDLLHSKKRAAGNVEGWEGPEECDDEQIEYLIDRVGYLISDEARYSYRYDMAEREG